MIQLTPHQREALAKATAKNFGVLIGSPGTGKTASAAVHIAEVIRQIGENNVCACAPTGKAAVRLTEAMRAYDLPLRARTIHSTLKVQQNTRTDGWSFEHNRTNPLPFRFIVADESSMTDTTLMASFLAARPKGCRVLLLGDVGQLPPVGHGAPLRDLIAAGVPCGELREIHRNQGGIVQACADIRDGKAFKCEGNLINRPDSDQLAATLDVLRTKQEAGLDPVWDCQVLVAVNKKSKLSRKEVNRTLQNALNQNPAIQGSVFRLGDKVVNTKNSFYLLADSSDEPPEDAATNQAGNLYVANGELGRVVRIEPKSMEVQVEISKLIVRVPRGVVRDGDDGEGGEGKESEDDSTGTGCNWDLAYGLTVHKSQGSEWKSVLVLIDEHPGAGKICDRSWLYTAISRGKDDCYLIGKLSVAQGFCRNNNISKRKTFLRELLEERI